MNNISVNFENETLDGTLIDLFNKLSEKYEYIGSGRNRIVFKTKNGKFVLKIPRNNNGNIDNFVETKKMDFGFPVPRNKRIILNDFCCLMMEYVTPVSPLKGKLPSWTGWIDCCQVGYTGKGSLVAYDYA